MAVFWQASRLAGNVLFIVLARRSLAMEQFGYLTVALSFGVVVLFLLVGGLDRLLTREVARNPSRGAAFLLPSLTYQLFLFASIAATIPFVAKQLHLSSTEKTLFYLVGTTSACLAIAILFCGFHMGLDRFRNVVFVYAPANLFLIGGSFFLFFIRPSVIAWAVLWLLSRVVMLLSAIFFTLRARVEPDRTGSLRFFRHAIPLCILYLSSVLLFQVDTLALRRVAGAAVVGLYQEAFRIIVVSMFFLPAVTLPYFPVLAVTDARSVTHRRDWGNMTVLMLFVGTSAVALFLPLRRVLLWLAFGHTQAAPFVAALVGFMLMRFIFSSYLQFYIINGPALLCAFLCFLGSGFSWFITTRYAASLGPLAAPLASFIAHLGVVLSLAVSALVIYGQHPFNARFLAVLAPTGAYSAAFHFMPPYLRISLIIPAILLSFLLLPSQQKEVLLQILHLRRKKDAAG